jgi:hypothetical protein
VARSSTSCTRAPQIQPVTARSALSWWACSPPGQVNPAPKPLSPAYLEHVQSCTTAPNRGQIVASVGFRCCVAGETFSGYLGAICDPVAFGQGFPVSWLRGFMASRCKVSRLNRWPLQHGCAVSWFRFCGVELRLFRPCISSRVSCETFDLRKCHLLKVENRLITRCYAVIWLRVLPDDLKRRRGHGTAIHAQS